MEPIVCTVCGMRKAAAYHYRLHHYVCYQCAGLLHVENDAMRLVNQEVSYKNEALPSDD